MKIIRHFIPFIILSVLFFSCTNKDEIKISGQISECNNNWIWLHQITPHKLILIDSIQPDISGIFEIRTKITEPAFIRLSTNKRKYVFLIIYPGEKVNVRGDYNNLQDTYDMDGSYESRLLRTYMKQFNFALNEKRKIADSFYTQTQAGVDIQTVREKSIERHNRMKTEIRKFTQDFLLQYKCFLASVFILDLQLGPNDPVLTIDDDYKYYAMVDSCLSAKFRNMEVVQEFNKSFIYYNENKNELGNLKPGNKVPEIILTDINGDTVKLSDFQGSYVLIDFWASWNKKCRNNNSKLSDLYKKYNSKGFKIFQVSLDKNFNAWKNAVDEDAIEWTNVSDLKFWDSYVIKLYQVYNIPMNFLIDRQGKLIVSNIEMNELEIRLASIFK